MGLEEQDKETLRKEQMISKNANAFIKRIDGIQDWWPIEKGNAIETLNVRTFPQKNQLAIQLNATIVPNRQGGFVWVVSGTNKNARLVCEGGSELVKTGSGQIIYSLNTGMQNWKYTRKDITTHLKVNVSLEKCEPKEKEGQTVCPLKVLTGSDLDWSSKVTQRATLKIV